MRGNKYDYEDEPYFVIEQPGSGVGTFLLGLAIGAGAAFLFAPRSGEETREMLGTRARGMRDSAKQMVDDMTGTIQDTFDEAKSQVNDQLDEARSAMRRGKRHVRDAMDAGRSAAHEARAELERKLAEQQKTTPRDESPYSPESMA